MSLRPMLGDDDLDDPMIEDNLSEDDNAAEEVAEPEQEEDPLLLAVEDLEGRVVTALDDVKIHPGVRTSTATSVGEELAILLRPVLEIAAHTGPSIARTYYQGVGAEGMELSVESVYERVVSDLLLPVMLEMAQSETGTKRAAALEFFRQLYRECHKAGSWLDTSTSSLQAGPYGPGLTSSSAPTPAPTPAQRAVLKRRHQKRLAREGEILRYWVSSAIACLQPGVFSNDDASAAIAGRAIIAAGASLRPALRHMADRITDADDRGAARLYTPVMKLTEAVLKQCFLQRPNESILSSCVKFLEILVMCCSRKPKDASRRRRETTNEDFSLEDLPVGHPTITRESLEQIAEYAFAALRGLALVGGQVKVDVNLLSDMMLGATTSPSSPVVSILKPAALAFLELEAALAEDLDYQLDRAALELDFVLEQKSYSLTINAVAALAVNRPVYFKEAAVCLARRAVQPPVFVEGGTLTRPAVLALTAQLKASCLTMLRNSLSVTSGASEMLHRALETFDMTLQADKALAAAKQATALKTAGRAARNRANMYYEWDQATDARTSKRQRETDDALAQMRAAKAARGLGHGIRLPTSMADAVDLVMANLVHLPPKRPASSKASSSKPVPVTLDSVVDAILTNGGSLIQEEGRWYDRDGGTAWSVDLDQHEYSIGEKLTEVMDIMDGPAKAEAEKKRVRLFRDQCDAAAAAAFGRIMSNSTYSRSKALADLGNRVAARLAFTLRIPPAALQRDAYSFVKESLVNVSDGPTRETLERFVDAYPLAALGLGSNATTHIEADPMDVDSPIGVRLLNEALLLSTETGKIGLYEQSLDLWVASSVHAGMLANDKPADNDRKRAAARSAAQLQRDIVGLPRLTKSSLLLVSAMCDIEEVTKRASEASRKTAQESIAASAAIHAAKAAAEKRATAALLVLRDAAFQRDDPDTRRCAVECAVAIASGRLPASASIQDKALKLTMNVLYAKNETLARDVVDAATMELEHFSRVAIEAYDAIQKANDETEKDEHQKNNPLGPQSDEEKQFMDRMRKPAVLYMALCVRRPEIIEKLFQFSSRPKANVLSKAVRINMSKLARAAASKEGAADIAMRVAAMCSPAETPMLLSFLENLDSTDDDVIEACFRIQESKASDDRAKDPRYIIPVVAVMKRVDLVARLPEFVAAEDKIFLAALVRMGDRHQRQALLFRDEPDEEAPSLKGMTLCEQLVFLHKLDFAAASLPQKRYLAAIKLCLEDDEVYNDRVLMSALDHMSGTFLTGSVPLPLAFMRTVILTCTKHESLHSWICHVLLPRLVEGKIYEDPRQWEGWMRCAHMLEKSDDPSVSNVEAIQKLPPEQLMQYQTKWAGK